MKCIGELSLLKYGPAVSVCACASCGARMGDPSSSPAHDVPWIHLFTSHGLSSKDVHLLTKHDAQRLMFGFFLDNFLVKKK